MTGREFDAGLIEALEIENARLAAERDAMRKELDSIRMLHADQIQALSDAKIDVGQERDALLSEIERFRSILMTRKCPFYVSQGGHVILNCDGHCVVCPPREYQRLKAENESMKRCFSQAQEAAKSLFLDVEKLTAERDALKERLTLADMFIQQNGLLVIYETFLEMRDTP